jgi:hypothetical protein
VRLAAVRLVAVRLVAVRLAAVRLAVHGWIYTVLAVLYSIVIAERLRTGTIFRPPEGNLPDPYYRSEGSAIAIWRGFPSKFDHARPAPANYGRTS